MFVKGDFVQVEHFTFQTLKRNGLLGNQTLFRVFKPEDEEEFVAITGDKPTDKDVYVNVVYVLAIHLRKV